MSIKLPALAALGLITPSIYDRIALVQPMQHAPLYAALIAKGWGEPIPNEKHEWGDQKMPSRRTAIDNGGAAYTNATTTLVVDASSVFFKNCLIHCEATGEVMLCKSITDATTIVVARGIGGVAAHANSVANNANLKNIGPAMPELSTSPTARDYAPTMYSNYVQTFRKPIEVTGRVKRTKQATGPERQRQMETAMAEQLDDFELALMFGGKSAGVNDADGKRVTAMGGLYESIATNVDSISGTINLARLNQFAKMAFAYGSKRKMALCGATALQALGDIFGGKLEVRSGEVAVGLEIRTVLTTFGTLDLVQSPHLVGDQAGDILVVDAAECSLHATSEDGGGRPREKKDIQANDVDGSTDELFAEFTLRYGPELHHARAKGITGYAA